MNSSCRCRCMQRPITVPFEHVQCGEQCRRSMAFVVVGHGAAAAGFQRQSRLGTVERLDLALFVDRQHHRMGGRIEIKADDIGQFRQRTAGSRERLKLRTRCGWSLVRRPDALHRAQRHGGGVCHGPPGPIRGPMRRRATRERHDVRHFIGRRSVVLPGLRVLSRSRPVGTFLDKTLLPAPDHGAADADLFRHIVAPARPPAEARTTRAARCYLPARLRSDAIAFQAASCLPRSTTRILSVPCSQNRMATACCESIECVRALEQNPFIPVRILWL